VIYVVSAYLSAYNARAFGVKDYIAQFMFNSPPGHSDAMDLAKMLAALRLIEPLREPDFRIWTQTRTGLLSYPLDIAEARAHLASSIYLQMALHPDIVHVVGQSEADHAATADDVIEACTMAKRVIENAVRGAPDMTSDPSVVARVQELIHEAAITLQAIKQISKDKSTDPLTDAGNLAHAVQTGILDAPQLKNNQFAQGSIRTSIIDGACLVIDNQGKALTEKERLVRFLD
jgi:hypothetical protein